MDRRPTVHINRPYGQAALCGVHVAPPMFWGGPATATCKRCLAHPVVRDWSKRTAHSYLKTVAGCWCEACADARYRQRFAKAAPQHFILDSFTRQMDIQNDPPLYDSVVDA